MSMTKTRSRIRRAPSRVLVFVRSFMIMISMLQRLLLTIRPIPSDVVDGIISSLGFYKGSGSPTFYTTLPVLTSAAAYSRCSSSIVCGRLRPSLPRRWVFLPSLLSRSWSDEQDLVGIIVNLKDYTIGADKGGEVNFFDDFDIDYNQYKYLLRDAAFGCSDQDPVGHGYQEGGCRCIGGYSEKPDFDGTTVVVTRPRPGVTYKNKDTGVPLTTAAPVTLADNASITVVAEPASGALLSSQATRTIEWTFKNNA